MCIGAIVAELAVVQEFQCPPRYAYMALAGLHDCFIMTFTQIMFALHYAHDYYITEYRGERSGLAFSAGQAPDSGSFLYFAIVIGASGQTVVVGCTS